VAEHCEVDGVAALPLGEVAHRAGGDLRRDGGEKCVGDGAEDVVGGRGVTFAPVLGVHDGTVGEKVAPLNIFRRPGSMSA